MSDDTEARIAALDGKEVEFAANVHDLMDHEWELTHGNCRYGHQSAVLNVIKDRHEVRESEDKKSVTDARVELENVREVMHLLEKRASTNSPPIQSAVEDRN